MVSRTRSLLSIAIAERGLFEVKEIEVFELAAEEKIGIMAGQRHSRQARALPPYRAVSSDRELRSTSRSRRAILTAREVAYPSCHRRSFFSEGLASRWLDRCFWSHHRGCRDWRRNLSRWLSGKNSWKTTRISRRFDSLLPLEKRRGQHLAVDIRLK